MSKNDKCLKSKIPKYLKAHPIQCLGISTFRCLGIWLPGIFVPLLFLSVGGKLMEIKLPDPILKGKVSIEECMERRRSVRSYKSIPLTLTQISQLLWSVQGKTGSRGLRSSPSAGATYPLEIRIVKSDGVFRYVPEGHKLVQESAKDVSKGLASAALGQSYVEDAPCSFIMSAVYARTTGRYGERGKRYVLIEIGHAAENLHLQAVALGLGSVPIGAFDDSQVKTVLDLPENEEPLYIIPVGYPE
jgi:SagB-type dehydrogenase family enzyme